MLSHCSVEGSALAGTDEATVCDIFAEALGGRAASTDLVVTIGDAELAPHHLARFADTVARAWDQKLAR